MDHQIELSSRPVAKDDVPAVNPAQASCAPAPAPSSASARGVVNLTIPAPPSTAVSFPLTSFQLFPKLPYELRRMIFVVAIKDSAPRILAIQPQYREHPALVQTSKEARDACKRYYFYCASRQRTRDFRFFIDYEKDLLYLNTPFTLLGGKCQLSPLQATHSIYPEFLELIETLAINLKEVRNLSGAHRGSNNIWTMLSRWCPKLKELKIVVNNFPANGLFLDFIPIQSSQQPGRS